MFTDENGDISPKKITKLVLFALGLLFGIGVLFSSFEVIQAGERGVVLVWGRYDRVLGEGFHIVNPVSSEIVVMNVRTQKSAVTATAASQDLQTVSAEIALNFHVDPVRVGTLYQQVGEDYDSVIISPAIQESLKAATALFTAEELISKRVEVKENIKAYLSERLNKSFIIVDDFSIINFDFSPDFNKAIEHKVTAEQDALAAKNKLEQVKFEAEQRIETAKAQAESIRIQAQAVTQQGGKDYVQLQAIEKWNGVLPATFLPNAAVPFINLQ